MSAEADNRCELHPFGGRGLAGLRLSCAAERRTSTLRIAFHLQGDLGALAMEAPAALAERRHSLWEGTCFELFFGLPGSQAYWELNLSPAGHWNVYCFDEYRRGMREESAFSTLPFEVRRQEDGMCLLCRVDLRRIGCAQAALQAAPAAVLRSRQGALSYWAPVHPGPRPDFHRREGFLLNLAP